MIKVPEYPDSVELANHLVLMHRIYVPRRTYTYREAVSLMDVHTSEHSGALSWECIVHVHGDATEQMDEEWTWDRATKQPRPAQLGWEW